MCTQTHTHTRERQTGQQTDRQTGGWAGGQVGRWADQALIPFWNFAPLLICKAGQLLGGGKPAGYYRGLAGY